MSIFRFLKIQKSPAELIQRHPIEMVYSIFAALLSIYLAHSTADYHKTQTEAFLLSFVLLFPLYFSFSYLLNYRNSRWYKFSWLYAIVLAVALYYIPFMDAMAPHQVEIIASRTHQSFWLGLGAIHFLLFFFKSFSKDNKRFVYETLITGVNLFLTNCLSLIAIGLVSAIYYSTITLFRLSVESHQYLTDINIFIGFVASTLFFLHLETHFANNNPDHLLLNKAADTLINYLLSPAVMIYTLLMYLYLVSILLSFELPEGFSSTVILPFISLGLICIALRQFLARPKWTWFFCHFAKLSIVPLGLLWLGIYVRISSYGLTEMRLWLIAISALITLFVLLSLIPRMLKYQYFASLIIVSIVVMTMILNPKKIEAHSQNQQFIALATKLGFMDAQGNLHPEKVEQLNQKNTTYEHKHYERLAKLATNINFYQEFGIHYDEDSLTKIRQGLEMTYDPLLSEHANAHHIQMADNVTLDIGQFKKITPINYGFYTLKSCENCTDANTTVLTFHNSERGNIKIKQATLNQLLAQGGITNDQDAQNKYSDKQFQQAMQQLFLLPTDDGKVLLLQRLHLEGTEAVIKRINTDGSSALISAGYVLTEFSAIAELQP